MNLASMMVECQKPKGTSEHSSNNYLKKTRYQSEASVKVENETGDLGA